MITPLSQLRKRFRDDYLYSPKPKARRGRLNTGGTVEGQTLKKQGDIVIASAHKKGIEIG